ncbi:hypothetical protein CEXT_167721 [Caerostris extrusa]|uniref:Uncharacterized protein n=1 Tax=Caerostris extrusa TaxID=172846 RepID=A0AAV4MKF0_CAEEX|nr:hypothetical protein CEXT_167721 [Caerostris extrusa]
MVMDQLLPGYHSDHLSYNHDDEIHEQTSDDQNGIQGVIGPLPWLTNDFMVKHLKKISSQPPLTHSSNTLPLSKKNVFSLDHTMGLR